MKKYRSCKSKTGTLFGSWSSDPNGFSSLKAIPSKENISQTFCDYEYLWENFFDWKKVLIMDHKSMERIIMYIRGTNL